MPEQDILLMFNKMVDALRYLHDHKILHRYAPESHTYQIVATGLFVSMSTVSVQGPENCQYFSNERRRCETGRFWHFQGFDSD